MPSQSATAKLGIALPGTDNPDYESTNGLGILTTAVQALESALLGAVKLTAAGAISIAQGTVFLQAGSAAAMTLAAPTATVHDGLELRIVALDAFAYTVTTPSNKINGNKHIATWTAAVGNSLRLVAYGGAWYTSDALNGVALS